MNSDTLHQIATREVLFPLGVSLAIVGIFLRGFAQGNRRAAELRKQHALEERKLGDSSPIAPFGHEPGLLERKLPLLANAVLVAGLVVTVLAFFRD